MRRDTIAGLFAVAVIVTYDIGVDQPARSKRAAEASNPQHDAKPLNRAPPRPRLGGAFGADPGRCHRRRNGRARLSVRNRGRVRQYG